MRRLLQQGEIVVALFGSLGSVALSILFVATERTKNTSALALAITGGFALFSLLLGACMVTHARHIGQLRWLWPAIAISLTLWYAPVLASTFLYNASAGIIIYVYAGVLGIASIAIGVLRELLSRALAQS